MEIDKLDKISLREARVIIVMVSYNNRGSKAPHMLVAIPPLCSSSETLDEYLA